MEKENFKGKQFIDNQSLPVELDAALRPPSFSDFTGQKKTLERLEVMVGAAKTREEALKHILLCGPRTRKNDTCSYNRPRIRKRSSRYLRSSY